MDKPTFQIYIYYARYRYKASPSQNFLGSFMANPMLVDGYNLLPYMCFAVGQPGACYLGARVPSRNTDPKIWSKLARHPGPTDGREAQCARHHHIAIVNRINNYALSHIS